MPWNSTLAHIYLDPALPFRQRMIDGIVKRVAPFDALQIDFESVAAADGTAYLNFLAAVKKALPRGKLFSVAVMARWQAHKVAGRSRHQVLGTMRLGPVARVSRWPLGLTAIDVTPDAAQQSEAIGADAAPRRLMMIGCAEPAACRANDLGTCDCRLPPALCTILGLDRTGASIAVTIIN